MTEHLTHPTPEQLRAFNLGRLSDEDAEAVATHIDECQPCCETVLGLSADDTFVALLQDANESPIDEISGQLASAQDTSAMDDGEIPPELVHHSRYTIIGPVGKGGMGDVFKAEHRMMERMVALKVIKRELFSRPEAVQRFHREVKTAAKLSHPNIVTAFDAEQAGDVHFLVMEYVDGVDLARNVKVDGPLSITEACDYIRQAARGLQHAHEQGMVHRDIKPHNLMLSGDGTVKILDFGLATLATEVITTEASGEQSRDEPVSRKTSRLTTLGTMMGTPDFISPEQAGEPRAADIRSDIYSLGCTFFYLLTGRPPFTEGSAMEKVKAHGESEPEPIENVRGDVPPELADIVRRMMAKQPAERFQAPAEVSDALAPFAPAARAMQGVGKQDDFRLSPASSRASSRWPPTILPSLALGAFALILVTIIYVATDGGTLVVDSDDDSVEVTVHPVSEGSKDEEKVRLGIADTITGSTVKWFRRGEYAVALKGTENDFELSQDRFVLKRGDNVIVKVERKKHSPSQSLVRKAKRDIKVLASGPTGAQGNQVRALPRAWTDLLFGAVTEISIGTVPDDPLTVAIYDDSQHLNLLQATNGQWKSVASQKLPASKTPRILVADFDEDGLSEILVCSKQLQVYTVAPGGYSLAWSSRECFADAPAPRIGIADFDGDGRKDVAVLNYKKRDESRNNETQSLYVYTRHLSQPLALELAATATFTDKAGYHSTGAMAIADFTGDSRKEIVVGNSNGFLWLIAFENGQLHVRRQWEIPRGGAIGHGLSAGNFDNDAAAELLVGTNVGYIYVIDFVGECEPRVLASAMAGRLAYGVAAGDIDGDQRDDFVLTRGHLGYAGMTQEDVVVEVWKLRGSELRRVWQQETVDLPRPLVHDLDGDGRDEIVVLSLHGKELQFVKPTGLRVDLKSLGLAPGLVNTRPTSDRQ